MTEQKDLAKFLLEREGALEVLLNLFYAHGRTITELYEDLRYDEVPGDISSLLTDMSELKLIEIQHQLVNITDEGEKIAESLLENS